MRKDLGVGFTVIASLLLAPTVVRAQAIGGRVTDTVGGVLPGVTVEARSPALIEQVRTAVTDGAGQYLIVELQPGTYSVTFTLPGFTTIVREGIQLTTGFTANVNAQLPVGAVEETITVTGASPIVDVQNVTRQQVATRDIIDTVPVAKSFQSLGVLIPGISTAGTTSGLPQDVGGQSGNNHMTMQIHGGRTGDQHILVDGMSVEAMTREDSTAFHLSDANFQEYAFDYSANAADTETGGVRVNLIPAEGSNTFKGGVFYNVAPRQWQSDNITDDLRNRGLFDPNRVKELWTVQAKMGGPIMRDRLWFFASHSRFKAENYAGATYHNQDVRARIFVPNRSRQAVSEQRAFQTAGRLTWQATPRNKVTAYMVNGNQCYCNFLMGTTPAIAGIHIQPEASVHLTLGDHAYQTTWMSPVTSRLLLEAGASVAPQPHDWPGHPDGAMDVPGILEVGLGVFVYRNSGAWWAGTKRHNMYTTKSFRGSLSYVTGTHATKVGFTYMTAAMSLDRDFHRELGALPLSYQTFRGSPIQATFYDAPLRQIDEVKPNMGIYAQDQWTLGRLTVNAGLRFDFFENSYPDHSAPPTPFVPASRFFPGQEVVSWKDLSPRLGAAYDLFGDAKTALKVTVSRYVLREAVGYSQRINPMAVNDRMVRAWRDDDGDFFPDGDPFNPEPNGELVGPSSNRNFGQPIINTFFDPDWAFGFGKRPADWEFSGGIQREVIPGLSFNLGYFRRIYTNFEVRDNRAVGPENVDFFCVRAPTDARLPGGGGHEICGIPDLNPTKVGQIDRVTTSADTFGTRQQHWNGVDVTVDARLQGIMLQGGLSTGKTSVNECDLANAMPEVLFLTRDERVPTTYCDRIGVSSPGVLGGSAALGGNTSPFLTQVKFLGAYTLPYDVQIAATYQTFPGPEIRAEVVYQSAEVQPSLGRALSESRLVRVNVIQPGTMYVERMHQVDLRFTKIVNVGGARVKAMFDLYNFLNASTVLQQENGYGPIWQRPAAIIPARLAKVGFQVDF